ncbi:anti-sigma factor [Brachybacterium sp. J144]|uniref:anti-sigma factor n=1 Tax=Brachybacterium sp. J144 TaxID=3116487 RepID=UPI002E797AD2|nr:anti-sigma factor [Brachybacterium sp. J144]MEE1650366.1 anti-sigma factor [Brachybacterium sp. J144]
MAERQHDMSGVWALDALDDAERAEVEAYLAQDAEAAAEAASFRETAAELAQGLPRVAPSADLKAAVMAQVSRTRQLSPSTPAEAPGPTSSAAEPPEDRRPAGEVVSLERLRAARRRALWAGVAAAALLLTSVAGLGLWASERAELRQAESRIEALEATSADAAQEQQMVRTIMASDDAAHVTVESSSGGALQVLYSRDQEAMVVQAGGLPDLPEDRTYQLWMIDEDGAHDMGVLTDADGTALLSGPMPASAQIGLSVEPAGGSPEPTDVVAVGEL